MRYLLVMLPLLTLFSCQQKNSKTVVVHDTVSINKTVAEKAAQKSRCISTDALILPGKQIGHILIGELEDSVISALGRPDAGDAAMGKELGTWYNKKDSANRLDVFFVYADTSMRAKAVKQIHITSSYFKTTDGIGVSSTLKDVRMHFPGLRLTQRFRDKKTKQLCVYSDINKGIDYEISIKQKDSICSGIIVYKTGEEINDMYVYLEMQSLD